MSEAARTDSGDTPLSLRWDHKPYWSAFKKTFGGDETTASVILAVATAGGPVSYSRNRNHYVKPARYKSRLYNYLGVTRTADMLGGEGLAIHNKVPPSDPRRRKQGEQRIQSSLLATPELVAITNGLLLSGPPLSPALPPETIILRDKHGNEVDYRDDSTTRKMRSRLHDLNLALREASISDGSGIIPEKVNASMVRIFNRSFKRGGRFYALGGGWQSMRKEARKQVKINDEPVVEIDYKTLHPAILYAQFGATLPDDAYAVDGWPRDLVKVALLILVNSAHIHDARYAIAHHRMMASVAAPGSEEAFTAAKELIRLVKDYHKPIAEAFHSDRGAELMSIDSQMAEAVMHTMLMDGVVVLPVHDSFLVQQSQAEKLEEAMLRVAYETGIEALQVDFSRG